MGARRIFFQGREYAYVFPAPYTFPSSPSLTPTFPFQLGGVGNRCELPQWVRPPNAMANLNLKERFW